MRSSIVVVIGLLVGAVAGPSFFGALSTLSWSTAADGNDSQRVAGRLYSRTGLTPVAEAMDGHVHNYTCGGRLEKVNEPGDLVLLSALQLYNIGLLREKYENLGVKALQSLSPAILGALDGCIGGSPISHLCLNYVRDRVQRATTVPQATKQSWLMAADRQVNEARCIIEPAK